MDGDPTDNNATLFANGYKSVLKPKFDDKSYTLVGEPGGTWDQPEGADAVRTAVHRAPEHQRGRHARTTTRPSRDLGAQDPGHPRPEDPRRPVRTRPPGLQNVLAGYQCGSVYKPIYLEAQAAAALALYLRAGEKPPKGLVNGSRTTRRPTEVPSVLLARPGSPPKTWTSTVIKDEFVKVSDICIRVAERVHRGGHQEGSAGRPPVATEVVARGTADRRPAAPLLRLSGIGKNFGAGARAGRYRPRRVRRRGHRAVGDNGAGKSVLVKYDRRHPHARRRDDLLGRPTRTPPLAQRRR